MDEITISQAIRKVKELKGKLAKAQGNAAGSMSYAVKEPPAYSFQAEIQNMTDLSKNLIRMQTAIARANANTMLRWEGHEVPLIWAVKRLEEIKGRITWLEALPVAAQSETVVETWEYQTFEDDLKRVKSEKKMRCELPQAERDKAVQLAQDEFNRLNDVVETINHRTSVLLDW